MDQLRDIQDQLSYIEDNMDSLHVDHLEIVDILKKIVDMVDSLHSNCCCGGRSCRRRRVRSPRVSPREALLSYIR